MQLTKNESFGAVYFFLEQQFKQNKSNDFAGLVSSMSLLDDQKPADIALWEDWQEAVQRVRQSSPSDSPFPIDEYIAFTAMYDFLYQWDHESSDFLALLTQLLSTQRQQSENMTLWQAWISAIEHAKINGADQLLKLSIRQQLKR